MLVYQKTILKLNELLGFSYTGREQDWEIEFADWKRLSEFIKLLSTEPFTVEEKYAMISLILSSYDDYLNCNQGEQDIWLDDIFRLIDHNPIYNELLNYWALWGSDNENDLFTITPIIRDYLRSI